jgi:hypothetical protein
MFFLALAGLVTLIFGLSHGTLWVQRWQVERKEEKDRARQQKYHERYPNNQRRGPLAISAHIYAVANKPEAYQRQQERSERRRAAREKLTIGGIFITAFLALGPGWIFYNQLEEMREERRAWVGPVSAGFPTRLPQVGNAAFAVVQYHNTGREPAIDVFSDLSPYIATLEDDNQGIPRQHIAEYVDRCRAMSPIIGSQVVFPTASFSSYTTSRTIEGNLIDWNVLYGTNLIFVTGCYVYNTLGTTHRTSFCFFFQNGPRMTPKLGLSARPATMPARNAEYNADACSVPFPHMSLPSDGVAEMTHRGNLATVALAT